MSSRSITTVNYASPAGRRQFLPALSRQPAITSDSIIPRQILSAGPDGHGPGPERRSTTVASEHARAASLTPRSSGLGSPPASAGGAVIAPVTSLEVQQHVGGAHHRHDEAA